MERLVYTSGVFDVIGKVSISVDRSGSFTPQLYIRHGNYDLIDYCWTTFGIGNIYQDTSSYIWYITGQGEILFVLSKMLPYLIEKDNESNVLLKFLQLRKSHREHNKPYSIEELNCILKLTNEGTRAYEAAREKIWKK